MKLLYFVCFSLLFSCGSNNSTENKDYSYEVDEGTLKNNVYKNDPFGWEMKVPETWFITQKRSLKAAQERTSIMNEDSSSISGIKFLLAFQKDMNNNFQSTSEAYTGSDAEYITTISGMREMYFNNYLDQKINVDTIKGQETISGVRFDVFELKLYDQKGKAYSTQTVYTCLRKNRFFTSIISTDNKEDKVKISDYFRKSIFK